MSIHGGKVLSTYTHVSDQWPTYGTKQIIPTTREGPYILDELLGNETDLPIHEHATDTHGATLVCFGLSDLVGKVLTPRVRDLGRITLLRVDTPAATNALFPHAGPLLADRLARTSTSSGSSRSTSEANSPSSTTAGDRCARPWSLRPAPPSCSTLDPHEAKTASLLSG
ncbi:Tn3 family transposase [Nonomuraea diastatica]|uniref:Tn3 transposase DDE domain-containing protein n=1 Tax=Nonomuraea diastatica TaxID=1848329 RepID=A0A4R4VHW3_9ACTN|nr:Tn3 family transposase [Nonomuraea diastatica]TDD03347.1 hypothetical protein E1294_50760 [Nonomuraea diastatica]